jgi:O-methyltransferase
MLASALKHTMKYLLNRAGYEIRRIPVTSMELSGSALSDQPQWINEIIAHVQPYTMTTPERIASLCHAVEYVAQNKIPGDIVECGVWMGGSVMAAILTLLRHGSNERQIYLYDTFQGMTPPLDIDRAAQSGRSASEMMANTPRTEGIWCSSTLEEVRKNVLALGYPSDRIVFVSGRVEETVPKRSPAKIALLRLDTDWYESTHHELAYLYPLLTPCGVLIIDDYGHWEGAKKATDEYIANNNLSILLNRIDYTGRIAVKT